jgi:nitrite reductase (NADH) small subunit
MSHHAAVYPLGSIDAIPTGEARVFRVGERDVAVFRCRSGEVYATDAECPHRGGPLADGLVGARSVICPLHGFVFDLCSGEAPGGVSDRLVTHRARVTNAGELTLELA